MGRAYYNENDPAAAAILREQIRLGVIAPGDVDERSIKEVTADDIRGYAQCHWFAGGGLWSVAARMAGWPDSRPLWSASCPCQPFSAAGKGAGTDDPRHLWPDLLRILRGARADGNGPPVIVGEQVSGAPGHGWFDGVSADLAQEGFASRSRDFPACAVDAPHQRNRLYWIAVVDPASERRGERRPEHGVLGWRTAASGADACLQSDAQEQRGRARLCEAGEERHGPVLADDHGRLQPNSDGRRRDGRTEGAERSPEWRAPAERTDGSIFTDAPGIRRQVSASGGFSTVERAQCAPDPRRNGSWWADAEWLVSPLDGKARRAKPGLPFLVDGLPGRVDLWRVGGNAIVPQAAAEVIAALIEAEAILAQDERKEIAA